MIVVIWACILSSEHFTGVIQESMQLNLGGNLKFLALHITNFCPQRDLSSHGERHIKFHKTCSQNEGAIRNLTKKAWTTLTEVPITSRRNKLSVITSVPFLVDKPSCMSYILPTVEKMFYIKKWSSTLKTYWKLFDHGQKSTSSLKETYLEPLSKYTPWTVEIYTDRPAVWRTNSRICFENQPNIFRFWSKLNTKLLKWSKIKFKNCFFFYKTLVLQINLIISIWFKTHVEILPEKHKL